MKLPDSASRYSTPRQPKPSTPRQRFIQSINDSVSLVKLFKDYFNIWVPEHSSSYKVFCPWGEEHSNQGVTKDMRVYPSTNTAMCFASHGHFTPVRLMAHTWWVSQYEAAQRLEREYNLGTPHERYFDKMVRLVEMEEETPTPNITYVLQYLLPTHPGYIKHQFDSDVRKLVIEWSEEPYEEDTFHKYKEDMWRLLDSKDLK